MSVDRERIPPHLWSPQVSGWPRSGTESVVEVEPGIALTIECGTHFQFRNTGDEDLCFVIVTMPPWPGAREARRMTDHWLLT